MPAPMMLMTPAEPLPALPPYISTLPPVLALLADIAPLPAPIVIDPPTAVGYGDPLPLVAAFPASMDTDPPQAAETATDPATPFAALISMLCP